MERATARGWWPGDRADGRAGTVPLPPQEQVRLEVPHAVATDSLPGHEGQTLLLDQGKGKMPMA